MLQQLSRISWASRQVRFTLIPLLALVLTHFVFYKKLPFEQGYEFPLQTFVSIVLWGICICEANALVYRYLNQISPLKAAPLRRLLLQMTHGLLATTIIYSILTLIFNWLEGAPFEWFAFLSYLLLLLGISGMENAIFLLKDFYDLYQNREIETSTIAPSERLEKPLLIKSGQRSLILNLDEIGLIYSSNGLVMLTTAEGQKHITQFTSLNEVEKNCHKTHSSASIVNTSYMRVPCAA
ncbi:MAG: hypothetical protein IPJ74_10105 [Saprospiraceae bacterium]|nr:hypothetical protein [Saprospiraceae bacterium]